MAQQGDQMNEGTPDITIRAAVAGDAVEMSAILTEILTTWGSERARSPEHIRAFYIKHPDQVSCVVAANEAGDILGFQSLKRAVEGNPYDVTSGWGVIGTYVKQGITGRGIGSRLFAATSQSARLSGFHKIDATIGNGNAAGQRYYEAMGFRTYRTKQGAVCKCFTLPSDPQG